MTEQVCRRLGSLQLESKTEAIVYGHRITNDTVMEYISRIESDKDPEYTKQ